MIRPDDPFISFDGFSQFVFKWTPRAIVAGIAGYYSLGIAYSQGLMAAIDRVAINILRNIVGYAGLGAIMPTFQWYAAWSVRISAAFLAGALYELISKVIQRTWRYFFPEPPLYPLPLKREIPGNEKLQSILVV